jgi:hypothetical protein
MATTTPRPKNWLLLQFRAWHSWLGIFLAGFIILVCLTGIYLNHKDLFRGDPAEKGRAEAKAAPSAGALTTTTSAADLPIAFDGALAVARQHWGETAIEKVELKDEHGRLVYKLRAGPGRELTIDAQSGAAELKEQYREERHSPDKKAASSGINWGKLMLDLHTGKVVGGPGKLLVDLTSLTLLTLTGTGIYMWAVPRWRKRQSARERAAAVQSAAKSEPETAPV